MQKGQAQVLILAGIVLAIALAGGIFYLGRITTPKPENVITSSPQPSPAPDETVYTESDRSANWKTYTNTKEPKFSFKYPSDKFIVEERVKDYFVIKPVGALSGFAGISIDARNLELDYSASIQKLKDALVNPNSQVINNGIKISGTYGPPKEPGMSLEGTQTVTAYLRYNNDFVIVDSIDKDSFPYFDQILSTFKFLP